MKAQGGGKTTKLTDLENSQGDKRIKKLGRFEPKDEKTMSQEDIDEQRHKIERDIEFVDCTILNEYERIAKTIYNSDRPGNHVFTYEIKGEYYDVVVINWHYIITYEDQQVFSCIFRQPRI